MPSVRLRPEQRAAGSSSCDAMSGESEARAKHVASPVSHDQACACMYAYGVTVLERLCRSGAGAVSLGLAEGLTRLGLSQTPLRALVEPRATSKHQSVPHQKSPHFTRGAMGPAAGDLRCSGLAFLFLRAMRFELTPRVFGRYAASRETAASAVLRGGAKDFDYDLRS